MARTIRQDEVEISIIPMDEDISPSDDMPGDVDFIRAVEEMVDEYGIWGWCCVNVQVKFAGLKGNTYLGCCSYKDEEDFKRGGYYNDMVDEAMQDLQQQVDKIIQMAGE